VRMDVSIWLYSSKYHDLTSFPVFYLRIFYTEGLLGWNRDEWPIYFRWCLLVTLTVTLVSAIILRILRPRILVQKYGRFLLLANILTVFLMTNFFFIAGRISMLPLQTGVHEMSKYGCCAQAIIYPRTKIPMYV
jgi:hypothetical protein